LEKEDYIGTLDYPKYVRGRLVSTMWTEVKKITKWSSINVMKIYLAKTSRSLYWKYNMSIALDNLGIQQELLKGVEKLTKSSTLSSAALALGQKVLSANQQMQEEEDDENDEDEDALPKNMNLLDQIIALIFARLIPQESEAEHWKQLALLHQHIKKEWTDEFGSLPPNPPIQKG